MKLISGGQTGVDLAALQFAADRGLAYGGWVPKGRTNEDGIIPDRFKGLTEAPDSIPATRTRLNVEASDATLILTNGANSPGTAVTQRFAAEAKRPCLSVSLGGDLAWAVADARRWLEDVRPAVLNIAGPRESEAPGIGGLSRMFLEMTLDDPPRSHVA